MIATLERVNAEGLTLIVVTHDPTLGERARRQPRMEDGALVADEPAGGQASA